MKIFILLCNMIIPAIMIYIGVLYNRHSNKRINKILDLFIPITMIGSGVGSEENIDFSKDIDLIERSNKRCGVIWLISGVITFVVTAIVLMINKADILNSTSFLDTNNVSVIMLEVEFIIVIMVFISVEFILRKSLYKKIKA